MDVELVEDHDLPVLQVIQRPHFFLAVGGLLGAEGRITGLGELDPHPAQRLGERFVKLSAWDEGILRVVEDRGQLDGIRRKQG